MDTEEKEVDLLVVVVENLKLLVLGPVVVGLLALGVGFALPKAYTSQAYLSLGESGKAVEAVVRSPAVLDVVLKQFPSNKGITDAGREELSKRIRFSGGGGASNPKSGPAVTKLEVDDESPERAQAP